MTKTAGRRESRVVAGSKRYSRISLLLFNCNTIKNQVTPWCATQSRIVGTVSVTRILVSNHATATKLVVHERCDKPKMQQSGLLWPFYLAIVMSSTSRNLLCQL